VPTNDSNPLWLVQATATAAVTSDTDIIDGDEGANDALLDEWPMPTWFGAPVWHMHESLARLERLAFEWPRRWTN